MIREILAIFACKLVYFVYKLFGLDYTNEYPAAVALKLCPNILEKVSQGIDEIIVTGTNGKTTTSRMVSQMLTSENIKHFSNRCGANIDIGITMEYVLNKKLFGKSKCKKAVIECDEGYAENIAKITQPKVIVVTNLCGDQASRFNDLQEYFNMIRKAILNAPDSVCCINKDDPVAMEIIKGLNNKIVFYSASGSEVTIDNQTYNVNLEMSGSYNIYNAAAACAAAKAVNILNDNSIKALEKTKAAFARMETFSVDNNRVTMCLIKNPTGANVVINDLKNMDSDSILILGINNYVGDDGSDEWLKSVNFKDLEDKFEQIYVFGSCADSVKKCFNMEIKEINMNDVISVIKTKKKSAYLLVNYTAMINLHHLFAKAKYLKDFWKE